MAGNSPKNPEVALRSHLDRFFSEHPVGVRDFRVTVALSGGPDSVALFLLCVEAFGAERVVAAHFDHGLRGPESDGDARFCERLAKASGAEFHLGKGDVATEALGRGTGTEDAARALRYAFLSRVAAECGTPVTLTAHTADDFAETVLMNFLRGSKLRGLAGIPETGPNGLGRPFLRVRKSEILEYLKARNQAYRTDSSNLDDAYLRNFLRNEVVPKIRTFNDGFERTMRRFAEYAEGLETLTGQAVERFFSEEAGANPQDGKSFGRKRFLSEPVFLQKEILARLYRDANGTGVGLSEDMVAEMLRFSQGSDGGKSKRFGKLELSRSKGRVRYGITD